MLEALGIFGRMKLNELVELDECGDVNGLDENDVNDDFCQARWAFYTAWPFLVVNLVSASRCMSGRRP